LFLPPESEGIVVRILLKEAVVLGILAILILARMVMDTTAVEDMMPVGMGVGMVVVVVVMAEEDIDLRTLPPNTSLEPTVLADGHHDPSAFAPVLVSLRRTESLRRDK
jgi:hypothetical protein